MGVLRSYKNVGELLHNLFGYKETSKWMLAHNRLKMAKQVCIAINNTTVDKTDIWRTLVMVTFGNI